MGIKAILDDSLKDYPGKIAPILFFGGCNYRCPACHARDLVLGNLEDKYTIEDVLKYLNDKKDWVDGVTLCGGEPTLQINIVGIVEELKKIGVSIKLDTNGNQFATLGELLKSKCVDYVAMDIKGPPSLYAKLVGKEYIDFRDDVEKGTSLTSQFPNYEFRTTIVPIVRGNEEINWITVDEIIETARWIVNETGFNGHKYFLQPFIARSKKEMIDERFSKENFPEEMHRTPNKLLEEMLDAIKKYLPNTQIR